MNSLSQFVPLPPCTFYTTPPLLAPPYPRLKNVSFFGSKKKKKKKKHNGSVEESTCMTWSVEFIHYLQLNLAITILFLLT